MQAKSNAALAMAAETGMSPMGHYQPLVQCIHMHQQPILTLCKAAAVASPAMPAPTTMTLSSVLGMASPA